MDPMTTAEIDARCPGNYMTVELDSGQIRELITGFGQITVKAEHVADQAVEAAKRYTLRKEPVGEHLAD